MVHIEWKHGGNSYLISGETKDVRVYRMEGSQSAMGRTGFIPLFDMAYDPVRNRARRTKAHAELSQDDYVRVFAMARETLAREVQSRREKHEREMAERQVAFAFAEGK